MPTRLTSQGRLISLPIVYGNRRSKVTPQSTTPSTVTAVPSASANLVSAA